MLTCILEMAGALVSIVLYVIFYSFWNDRGEVTHLLDQYSEA